MSKFDGIFGAAKERAKSKGKVSARGKGKTPRADATPVLRPGRPAGPAGGKRSDPDYMQISAYVRKQTHADAKIALLREGKRRELSELIEELIAEWLKART